MSNAPKYSRFSQQELHAWKPVLTPLKVIFVLAAIGAVCLPLGSVLLAATVSVVEVGERYDQVCAPDAADNSAREALLLASGGSGVTCRVELDIPERMKAPVYVYYGLTNYFQNHRRYVKSRNDAQLRGDSVGVGELEDCSPADVVEGSDEVINPCGLVAASFFNDTYTMTDKDTGGTVLVSPEGIAWDSDVQKRFGDFEPQNMNTDPDTRQGGAIDGTPREDERFIVWMRNAPLPAFRKLWGVINQDLEKGTTVVVDIANRYNTYRFDGKKYIVLSTTSWLGGKQAFLSYAYIAVGVVCLIAALVFLAAHLKKPQQVGDTSKLSWNRDAAASTQ